MNGPLLSTLPVPVDDGEPCEAFAGINPAGRWAVYWARDGGRRREWIPGLDYNRGGQAIATAGELNRRTRGLP